MLRTVLIFGVAAGAVVASSFFILPHAEDPNSAGSSLLIGYLVMLLALSLIFVGVKRFRDNQQGGVIKFLPALGIGLGISVVAGVLYVLGWELYMSVNHYDFADSYAKASLAAARAKGTSAAELARLTAQMATFKTQYADPLYRLPMGFVEIFPVGVLISLISAALLRNSRFLPAGPKS